YSHVSSLLLRASKNRFTGGRLARVERSPLDTTFWLIKWNDAQGSLRLFLDRQFCRTILGPLHAHKPTLLRDDLLELLVAVGVVCILLAELQSTLEQRLL